MKEQDNTIMAYWYIELNCKCPRCKKDVDLLDHGEFWDNRNLDFGEYDTDRSKKVQVQCPECLADFEVNLDSSC